MTVQNENKSSSFIPSREIPWLRTLFAWYVRGLFKLRFKRIWLKQLYRPGPQSRTVYFMNHTSWWDGIIPLLLNQFLFRQRGRALMEHKQLMRYRFFRWMGAFSIEPGNRKSLRRSLRFAAESLERESAALYIYPEGKLVPFSTEKPDFKKGLGWLYRNFPEVDFVPVGIFIHTLRHSKPELHIQIGQRVNYKGEIDKKEDLLNHLETELQSQLKDLQKFGGVDDSYFSRWG